MRFLPSPHVAARLLPLRPLIKFIYPGLAFRHINQLREPLPIRDGGRGKMALSLSLRPGRAGHFNSAKEPVKTGERRAPVRASAVDCPANIVCGHPVKTPFILGDFITVIKKVKSPLALATVQQELVIAAEAAGAFVEGFGSIMVAANILEEEGVIVENVGIFGVGVDGAFIESLGRIVITANSSEEIGIVTEVVGVPGVGVDGTFVEALGGIMVAANIGEEDGIVAEVVGVPGVGVDGTFIEGLGRIMVAANFGEEVINPAIKYIAN